MPHRITTEFVSGVEKLGRNFFSFYNARERILGVCCRPWGQLTMATNQITPLYPCMFVNMSVCLSVCMYVCMNVMLCNVM